jgi:hypothetical protein
MTTTKNRNLTDRSQLRRVSRVGLFDAMAEFEKLCDTDQMWHAVRIGVDGTPYVSTEASPCYSESEYFGRDPHPITLTSRTGHGQCVLPDDWCDDDGLLQDEIDRLIAEHSDEIELID